MDHTSETTSQMKLFLLRFSQHFVRATKQSLTNTDAQKRFLTYKTINCSCGNLWKPCHKTLNETGDNDVFAIILHSPSKPSLLKSILALYCFIHKTKPALFTHMKTCTINFQWIIFFYSTLSWFLSFVLKRRYSSAFWSEGMDGWVRALFSSSKNFKIRS